ncbi:PRC-barrel domain-containing protein [Paenibacillus sp. P25]|nr:PRC-barrel domain-containing protein [Paenibacillus sp. P25]
MERYPGPRRGCRNDRNRRSHPPARVLCLRRQSALSGDHQVKGLPVITVNGQQLGVIEDVYLETNWGKQVIGYELTEGFISDLKEGRKWSPMPESVTVGEDAVIVPVHASEALEEIFVPKEE